MEIAYLLPIAAFIALAAGLAVVFRGTGRIVARTREVEIFKSKVRDLAKRVDTSLDGAAGQIDAVRRRQVGPEAIVDVLAASSDAVERYLEEARALHGPRRAQAIRADLVEDLERAGRAIAMVEHGTGLLVGTRGPRELEAQTSVKRGYLNLVHARAAFARHALAAEALEAEEGSKSSPPSQVA